MQVDSELSKIFQLNHEYLIRAGINSNYVEQILSNNYQTIINQLQDESNSGAPTLENKITYDVIDSKVSQLTELALTYLKDSEEIGEVTPVKSESDRLADALEIIDPFLFAYSTLRYDALTDADENVLDSELVSLQKKGLHTDAGVFMLANFRLELALRRELYRLDDDVQTLTDFDNLYFQITSDDYLKKFLGALTELYVSAFMVFDEALKTNNYSRIEGAALAYSALPLDKLNSKYHGLPWIDQFVKLNNSIKQLGTFVTENKALLESFTQFKFAIDGNSEIPNYLVLGADESVDELQSECCSAMVGLTLHYNAASEHFIAASSNNMWSAAHLLERKGGIEAYHALEDEVLGPNDLRKKK